MSRRLSVAAAGVLVVAGLAGSVVFLSGQGLDRAEKWISIAGVGVSVVMGVSGLVLGWLTWRHAQGGRESVNAQTGQANSSGGGDEMGRSGPRRGAGPIVDASHAQGVQIGDGNTQTNSFG